MNLTRIMAIVGKEWREIVRDRLFFSLAFVMPTVLTLVFGYGLSLDVENIPLAVIDRDNTALSRDYVHRFSDSRYFSMQGDVASERAADALLTGGSVRAVLVIPQHFSQRLLSGRRAEAQTLIDGTFPFRAQTAKGYVEAINASFSMEILSGYLMQNYGSSPVQARNTLQPVRIEVRYLYNQSVKSVWSIAPKLLMAIMMISPPFLTALGIVREKESGSIFNIYSSTVTRGEFLLGKLLPYIAISSLNVMILWVLACFLFGAPFKGNPLFFFAAAVLYVSCTTGIGLLVSAAVRTQVAAIIGTMIATVVPAVLYSGILIPISSLSAVASVIAHLLPGMYFADIVTGSFLKGIGFAHLWFQVLAMAAYAAALYLAGYLLFRKRTSS